MGLERQHFPILVVDDYHAMVRTIHHMLRQLGFTYLFEANDGHVAWRCLNSRPYRLVISDLNMRAMGGKLKTLPFIMVTAEGERDRVVEAMAAGVTDYIVKPFTIATLKTKLASAIGDLAA